MAAGELDSLLEKSIETNHFKIASSKMGKKQHYVMNNQMILLTDNFKHIREPHSKLTLWYLMQIMSTFFGTAFVQNRKLGLPLVRHDEVHVL